MVILASLALASLIAAAVYRAGFGYFTAFQSYEPYGRLTSRYLVHAGLVVSGWLVFVSVLSNFTATLAKPSKSLLYLLRQPGTRIARATLLLLRSFIPTVALLSIFWIPAVLAFAQVYAPYSLVSAVVMSAGVTIVMAAVIMSLAAVLSVGISRLVRGHETLAAISAVFGLIVTTLGLLRFILPQSLGALLRIDIDRFNDVYWSLPLNTTWLPTNSILQYVESGEVGFVIWPLLSLILLSVLSVALFIQFHGSSIRHALAAADRHALWSPPTRWWRRAPIFLKECLSLLRISSERNAILFFYGLLIAFFFFLQRAFSLNDDLMAYETVLLPFALGAMLFIVTALLLRLVFPHMAREAESAWYMLREPVPVEQWQRAKVWLAGGIALDIALIAAVGWWLLPIDAAWRGVLIAFSLLGVVTLTALAALIGLLEHDWEAGREPGSVSTSLLGLLTLLASLATTGVLVGTFALLLLGVYQVTAAVLGLSATLIGVILVLSALIRNRDGRYSINPVR
jgi:hypothetical protein